MGPLDLAFGPCSIWTQVIPSFSTIFSVARVVEKSTVLGIQFVDSMTPWRVWAHHSFNEDCSQSFSGPSGRPKEPTAGPTFPPLCRLGVRKTFLGTQSVASLTLSGVQAKSLLNKDCLQSFLAPLGHQGGSFNRDLRVTRFGLR